MAKSGSPLSGGTNVGAARENSERAAVGAAREGNATGAKGLRAIETGVGIGVAIVGAGFGTGTRGEGVRAVGAVDTAVDGEEGGANVVGRSKPLLPPLLPQIKICEISCAKYLPI